MIVDRFAGQHTATSPEAVQAFEAAVLAIAAHRPEAGAGLETALTHDPDLVAAHALKGLGAVMLARSETMVAAKACLARCEGSAGPPRRQRHRAGPRRGPRGGGGGRPAARRRRALPASGRSPRRLPGGQALPRPAVHVRRRPGHAERHGPHARRLVARHARLRVPPRLPRLRARGKRRLPRCRASRAGRRRP